MFYCFHYGKTKTRCFNWQWEYNECTYAWQLALLFLQHSSISVLEGQQHFLHKKGATRHSQVYKRSAAGECEMRLLPDTLVILFFATFFSPFVVNETLQSYRQVQSLYHSSGNFITILRMSITFSTTWGINQDNNCRTNTSPSLIFCTMTGKYFTQFQTSLLFK